MFRSLKKLFQKDENAFLRDCRGVVHVGANLGQERRLYDRYKLNVVWVEPIPDVFKELQSNIADRRRQKALNYLVTDQDDAEYTFHVASNDGASSSILDPKEHAEIWPEVTFEKEIKLKSKKLTTLLSLERISLADYNVLIMDTQGSELLVLKGAEPILDQFDFIKTEVPDFESYEGCATLSDITAYLEQRGFKEYSRDQFAQKDAGQGCYYDVIFSKISDH